MVDHGTNNQAAALRPDWQLVSEAVGMAKRPSVTSAYASRSSTSY